MPDGSIASHWHGKSGHVRRPRAGAALLLVAAMLTGLLPAPIAAQGDDLPGVGSDSYESPVFGFTLGWDDRTWEVVDATSDGDGDTLILTNEVSTLYISGTEGFDGDARSCSIEIGSLVADADAFETYPSESGDRGLDPEDYSYLVDCRELVSDEAVLIIVHVFPADELGTELVEAEAVTQTIEIEPARGGAGDEDDDLADAGVDGNSYESPDFGYTLEWDPDIWSVNDASSESGADVLNLINDDSSLIISAFADLGDVDECLDLAVEIYSEDENIEGWELLEDEDGDPIEGSSRRRAYGAYVHTVENDDGDPLEYVNYIECRRLDSTTSILISHLTGSADFDDQTELRDELLDALELP